MFCILCEIYAYYASHGDAGDPRGLGLCRAGDPRPGLRHPELEVVALGSDSLAGSSASALDVRLNGSLPAFVGNDEARAPAPT